MSARGRRVLLVDDDVGFRAAVRALLELEAFEVEEAGDGAAAIAALSAGGPFCLVLLDVRMPAPDGWEVYRWIRSLDRFGGLPVIMVTAWPTERAPVEPMPPLLRKPFPPDELLLAAERACGR